MTEPNTTRVEEMGSVHHIVLYWAVDGGPTISPLQGLREAATPAGEFFVLFDPQPLPLVQAATIDLVRGGFVILRRERPSKVRAFTSDEAIALLAEESTWTGKGYYELAATDAGHEAFTTLHERHGEQYRKATAEARRRYEEFLQRHPDDVKRREEWLEALGRWIDMGEGEMPKPPEYEGEPPPYDGDAPREVNTERWGEAE